MTDLYNYLYALAATRYSNEQRWAIVESERPKHLTLLDGIALMLVKKAKNEVAAVSLTQIQRNDEHVVTFYYSKNERCSNEDRDFVEFLKKQAYSAHSGDRFGKLYVQLLHKVADRCLNKYNRRRAKVYACWTIFSAGGFDGFKTPRQDEIMSLASNLGSLNKLNPANWNEWLQEWLGGLSASTIDPWKAVRDIHAAYHLTHNFNGLRYLENPNLFHRLQKLGQYATAVKTLIRNAKSMGTKVVFEAHEVSNYILYILAILTTNSLKVTPLPQLHIHGIRPPLETLNNIGDRFVKEYVSFSADRLRELAPEMDATLEYPSDSSVVGVHCECTILMRMMNLGFSLGEIEIGVSKSCCWPCALFLEEIRSMTDFKISVSSVQAKTYGGWRFPSDENRHKIIQDRMAGKCEQALVAFLRVMKHRKLSDSEYNSSGEESSDAEEGLLAEDFETMSAKGS